MEQHPRLHAMSVWLHLIPRLHTAGANNIFPAHNAFTGHDDPSLFTGVVRPSSFSHGYQVLFNSHTIEDRRVEKRPKKRLPKNTSYSAHFLSPDNLITLVNYIQGVPTIIVCNTKNSKFLKVRSGRPPNQSQSENYLVTFVKSKQTLRFDRKKFNF